MPKMKSHSGTKKRFKVTGKGHVSYQKSGRRHILVNKNQKRLRSLRKKGMITPSFEAKLKQLIPYA
ncbi:MAG: 50S ribosomal protein L35 [Synergistaceae bacterium]|jgi:large subunit ribosomal protein L35|nr:50S ribosomal protein L35 [Synergistaceae bacterium]